MESWDWAWVDTTRKKNCDRINRESLVVAVVSVALARSMINRGLLTRLCGYGHKKITAQNFQEKIFFYCADFLLGNFSFLGFPDFYGTLTLSA